MCIQTNKIHELADKLIQNHSLEIAEYEQLISNADDFIITKLKDEATTLRRQYYGDKIFIRGLIEISNFCKNNCYYCGIRRDNHSCQRYRLNKQEILSCAETGYKLGFRTFVMQGGEDKYYTDEILTDIIHTLKNQYPDCAVTLSLGERSYDSYKKLYDSGADRYLLRHETAQKWHYELLHPHEMSYSNRMECLKNLKAIGYQVGCGFMVGSPWQTNNCIAHDLKFIEEFKPDMCGIGPFIPHHATPFCNELAGSLNQTCLLLSIIRIIHPPVLLPSTTALGTINPKGREMGILSGANVVMPNLSPVELRNNYTLYDNKINTGAESAQGLNALKEKLEAIGCEIIVSRGDINLSKKDL